MAPADRHQRAANRAKIIAERLEQGGHPKRASYWWTIHADELLECTYAQAADFWARIEEIYDTAARSV